ncbi:CAF1 family ribonuclease-domain-containing protein [Chytriomyces sp. MP71]|nr:CAF1 family ribonuclease-domain-containing protein [Chytriomyces sp. MP71]
MRSEPKVLHSTTLVTRSNLHTLQLRIRHVLSRAEFVAFDTEFSGLGLSSATRAADLRDRFEALRKVASSHALLALGVAAFERIHSEDRQSDGVPQYAVHCFEFLLMPMDDYVVSTSSLAFLVDHGFDFNRQIREGIPFKAGKDLDSHALPGTPNRIMRDLFTHILSLGIPLVIHNGLLDLMFIYQSFYAELPGNLDTFVADLADMFPAGIIDTKYVSDYVTREKASFLAYLFRKYERYVLKTGNVFITVSDSIDVNPSIPTESRLPNGMLSATLSFKQLTRLPDTHVSAKKSAAKRAKVDDKRGYCFQYAVSVPSPVRGVSLIQAL